MVHENRVFGNMIVVDLSGKQKNMGQTNAFSQPRGEYCQPERLCKLGIRPLPQQLP